MTVDVGLPLHAQEVADGQVQELREHPDARAGVSELVREAISMMEDPDSTVTVELYGPNGPRKAEFFVHGAEAALWWRNPRQGADQVARVSIDSIPYIIAEHLGLGPGGTDEELRDVKVPEDEFGDLLALPPNVGPKLRSSPLRQMLSSDDWNLATLEVNAKRSGGESGGYAQSLIGAAGYGWWLIDEDRGNVIFEPSRAADVWRGICDLGGFHLIIDQV